MKKITIESINAIYNKENYKNNNTEVFYSTSQDTSYLSLHGNTIVIYLHFKDELMISNCGWFSNTTKERLNGLSGVKINQNNFIWYLNGKEWNGELTTINK